MENQNELHVLEELGGEPLEGSGFEGEQPTSEDELVFGIWPDPRAGEEL
jgi:hypothetical protein